MRFVKVIVAVLLLVAISANAATVTQLPAVLQ